jgi:hypothetical protein
VQNINTKDILAIRTSAPYFQQVHAQIDSKKQKEQRAFDNFCHPLLKTENGFIQVRTVDSQIERMLSSCQFGRPITHLAAVCVH